ncbi:single-stranded-DNA-specific exonuclease [Anaerosphaera aminiphila DSM 21120]|uniref:Single-stranded-DNA-specific exonuclease RecJ n=1 Tax=Anaerosphaera aminiphila DSM 21120 TaxID=1120995 RepID=A0A1M5UUK1_9FIRM|nr:single-stranded-DNA-specific exonuclease RecJ [Anaerosphaera aminiphila]SHH66651.1 single-stranded-DNA-specific exonuclease [Anaerosphaera aminiphila DSM 21120]
MEKWFIKNIKSNGVDFKDFGINKYIYKILVNRNIDTVEKIGKFLNPNLENLNTPILLPDMIKASNFIINAIKENKKIRIVGDYDVDGVMSTYILVKGLKRIGANVDFEIPHRVIDGYGINKRIIEDSIVDGVELIITCDNGIAAYEEIEYANENNVDVIVTDHHEVPMGIDREEIIPNARAVIDPKLSNSKYPFREICGGVVAFKLINYLYSIQGIEDSELFEEFLPFAAIATICDVMPLVDENRIIIKEGLELINRTKNKGLKAIISESDLLGAEITSYHIGFVIGPTINSAGRLESAKDALNLFFEEDENKAIEIAKYLRGLNAKRQNMTDEGYIKVIDTIESNNLVNKFPILILKEDSIDESILGIIAGRVKEKYNRPTIVLTKSGDFLKGSGRSIENYDMFEKVSESKNYLERFGGHAMACGLSLKEENFKDFVIDVNRKSKLTRDDLLRRIYIDSSIEFKDVKIDLAYSLEKLKPFGNANPQPLFGTLNLNIVKFNVFGKNKNVIKLVLSDGFENRQALLFEKLEDFVEKISKSYEKEEIDNMLRGLKSNIFLDIVYTPEINSFRGNESLELKINSYRVSGVKL